LGPKLAPCTMAEVVQEIAATDLAAVAH